MKPEPLIVTVMLDAPSHQYFTQLRNEHFPKHFNYLEAHITLFHRLPSDKKRITAVLAALTTEPILDLEVSAVKSMGNGVAFEIRSPQLKALHKKLQEQFSPWLTTQDRKKIWPHITVQNKVTAYKASQTLAILQKDFTPFQVQGIGISTWLYKDGPWERSADYLFRE